MCILFNEFPENKKFKSFTSLLDSKYNFSMLDFKKEDKEYQSYLKEFNKQMKSSYHGNKEKGINKIIW